MTPNWTYNQPSALIVRDAQTGLPCEVAVATIPEALRPRVWFLDGRAAWQHNQYVTKHLVLAFLQQKPLKETECKRLGSYILAYTQHIAMMTWLFSPTVKSQRAVLQYNVQIIQTLKAILRREPFRQEYLHEMLEACMEYAIDPF